MNQRTLSATVNLLADSPEMAETYNATSVHQFNNGKLLIELLGVRAGEVVLDVGAGTGQLGAYVASIVGETGRVLAVDPLRARVEIAQRRRTTNFEVMVGRAEDLSQFPDCSFDVVYLNSVFHWLNDKALGLSEVFRVLKPGGRIGFNTTNANRPHDIAQLVREALAQEGLQHAAGIEGRHSSHTSAGLSLLVSGVGFIDCRCSEHSVSDHHPDPQSVIEWSASSQFGNFVSNLGRDEFLRFRRALVQLLEAMQTERGIQLERHLMFVIARRPGHA
jgi:arsenite methyltransferase